MTLAEYSMTAFALLNGARVVAYMPQIICVYRDPNGAVAVSLLTWTMFTAANLATVSYALTVSCDLMVAGVFALNALGGSIRHRGGPMQAERPGLPASTTNDLRVRAGAPAVLTRSSAR